MANDFQITQGAGILVAAEDFSGVGSGPYFERIKLWESTAGSNRALSKARDTVAGATDDGLLFLGIRNESLVTRASAEGRYGPVSIDQFGRLLVAPVTISGSGLALDSTVGSMSTNLGSSADVEVSGNGSLIAVTKRLRTLLGGGLPAALIGGRLPVDVTLTGGGTSSSFTGPIPGTGTAVGYSDGTNMQSPRVYDTDTGAGTQYTTGVVLRKSAAAGSVEAATLADPLRIDPTGTTTQPISAASLPSHPVTNAGTFAVQDSDKIIDNAVFTDGTSKVEPSGFILDEVAGTALAENDIGAARMDSKRAQVLVIEDETTRGRRVTVTAGLALKVDGSAVTQPISAASLPLPTGAATDRTTAAGPGSVRLSDGAAFYDATKTGQLPAALVGARLDVNIGASPVTLTVDNIELPAAAALTDAFANPTTTTVAGMGMGWNGATWDRLKSTTAQGLAVDVTRVQGTVTANALAQGTDGFTAALTEFVQSFRGHNQLSVRDEVGHEKLDMIVFLLTDIAVGMNLLVGETRGGMQTIRTDGPGAYHERIMENAR